MVLRCAPELPSRFSSFWDNGVIVIIVIAIEQQQFFIVSRHLRLLRR